VKFLVAIDTRGRVIYVSQGFGGRISDAKLTGVESEHLFGWLWPGAGIMVDKGFLIDSIMKKFKMHLIIPPRLTNKGFFFKEEVMNGRKISKSRIHIERAIRRGKEFKVIADEVPVQMLNNIEDIAQVCFFLPNYMGDLVLTKEETEEQNEDELSRW